MYTNICVQVVCTIYNSSYVCICTQEILQMGKKAKELVKLKRNERVNLTQVPSEQNSKLVNVTTSMKHLSYTKILSLDAVHVYIRVQCGLCCVVLYMFIYKIYLERNVKNKTISEQNETDEWCVFLYVYNRGSKCIDRNNQYARL